MYKKDKDSPIIISSWDGCAAVCLQGTVWPSMSVVALQMSDVWFIKQGSSPGMHCVLLLYTPLYREHLCVLPNVPHELGFLGHMISSQASGRWSARQERAHACTSSPPLFTGVLLGARYWPWWENLQHRNCRSWQIGLLLSFWRVSGWAGPHTTGPACVGSLVNVKLHSCSR